jgi:hypothetical protein
MSCGPGGRTPRMPSGEKEGLNMPDPDIAIKRIAQDAVRVQFDPGGSRGTAVFMIDLPREVGGTMDDADRRKVLLKAKSVAENFIDHVNREIDAKRSLG